jgi:hypothetical protein
MKKKKYIQLMSIDGIQYLIKKYRDTIGDDKLMKMIWCILTWKEHSNDITHIYLPDERISLHRVGDMSKLVIDHCTFNKDTKEWDLVEETTLIVKKK